MKDGAKGAQREKKYGKMKNLNVEWVDMTCFTTYPMQKDKRNESYDSQKTKKGKRATWNMLNVQH